jgi:glycine betaine/choline ABC-type transport system substrate-binding protein
MYEAVAKEEVDVICAFATDGRIAAYHLKPLKDDRNFFPPYHAAPVIREEVLKTHPKLGDELSLLGGLIDNATMQRLNYEVEGKKRKTAEVVKEFLKTKGIL